MKINKYGFEVSIDENRNTVKFLNRTFSWVGPILSDPFYEKDSLKENDLDTGEGMEDFFKYVRAVDLLANVVTKECELLFFQHCSNNGYDKKIHGSNVYAWWMHHIALEKERNISSWQTVVDGEIEGSFTKEFDYETDRIFVELDVRFVDKQNFTRKEEIGVIGYLGRNENRMLITKRLAKSLIDTDEFVGHFGVATVVKRTSKFIENGCHFEIIFKYSSFKTSDEYYRFNYKYNKNDVEYEKTTEDGEFVECENVRKAFTLEYDWKPTSETDESHYLRKTLQSEYFNQLANEIHNNAVDKGFWDDKRSVGESIALVHSELSEALEAARKDFPQDSHISEFGAFETELADAIIRILDMAGGYKVDVVGALLAKIEYNKNRPHKHGKKF